MRNFLKFIVLFAFILMALGTMPVLAEDTGFSLPNVYMDGMVLQANQAVTVAGTAKQGQKITVKLSDGKKSYTATAKAEADGRFSAVLKETFKPGYTPYTLTVTDGKDTKTFQDILFGDVYLLAGQSNMYWPMKDYYLAEQGTTQKEVQQDMEQADHPYLRVIRIADRSAQQPCEDAEIQYAWRAVTPDNVRDVSAIGYYFGSAIQQQRDYPIGLIDAAWSGSMIGPWQENGEIYNTHVYPFRHFSLTGCLWYQGESDEWTSDTYCERNVQLIEHYRTLFGQDMAFGLVQLANYTHTQCFHLMREAQLDVFRTYEEKAKETGTVNKVGLISIIDQQPVDPNNIHPSGKKEIGGRFVNWANAVIYEDGGEYAGPIPESVRMVNGSLEITYTHVGTGLKTREGQHGIRSFQVYDSYGNAYDAVGVITDTNKVTVRTFFDNPVKISYAYQVNNVGASLMNKEGFGAPAFAPIAIMPAEGDAVPAARDVKVRAGETVEVILEDIDPDNYVYAYFKKYFTKVDFKQEGTKATLTLQAAENTPVDIYPVTFGTANENVMFVHVYDAVTGDVNSDGTVDTKDLLALLRSITGWKDAINPDSADLNANGVVDMADAAILQALLLDTNAGKADGAVIQVSDAESGQDGLIAVPVTVGSNSGVNMGSLEVLYDSSALKLVSVENGDVFPQQAFYAGDDSRVPYQAAWLDTKDTQKTGTLMTLYFAAKEGAKPGTYPFSVMYSSQSASGNITVDTASGTVPMGSFENFKKVRTYNDDFYDVIEEDWYYTDVEAVYNLGLLNGVGDALDAFSDMTVEEAVLFASRIKAAYYNDASMTVDPGILAGQMDRSITRGEMAYLFTRALPAECFEKVHFMTGIPDTTETHPYYKAIVTLYAAGILQGNDEAGNFAPDTNIQRCEAVTIINRVVNLANRIIK